MTPTQLILYLFARAREPSTWATIASILIALKVRPDLVSQITASAPDVMIGISALGGIFLAERGKLSAATTGPGPMMTNPAASTTGMLAAILLGAGVMLTACASQTPTKAVLASCEGMSVSLKVAADLANAGKLSPSDIVAVDDVIKVVVPLCGAAAPPTDAASTAAALAPAAVQLTAVLQQRGVL